MEFGDWEINNNLWEANEEEDEQQEKRPHQAQWFVSVDGLSTEAKDTQWVSVEGEPAWREEVVLVVDADNGFNSLSSKLAQNFKEGWA